MTRILDFYAKWCYPCKTLAPILEELTKGYLGKVELTKIDIETAADTVKYYEVKSVPTVIIEHEGFEVLRLVGMSNDIGKKIREKIDGLLPKV